MIDWWYYTLNKCLLIVFIIKWDTQSSNILQGKLWQEQLQAHPPNHQFFHGGRSQQRLVL